MFDEKYHHREPWGGMTEITKQHNEWVYIFAAIVY